MEKLLEGHWLLLIIGQADTSHRGTWVNPKSSFTLRTNESRGAAHRPPS
jgi:hypothetical protein